MLPALLSFQALRADVTDPSGWVTYTIPAESRRIVGVPLLGDTIGFTTVSEVLPNGLKLAVPPTIPLGPGSAAVLIRTGDHAGLSFTATGLVNDELILNRPPGTVVAAGDTLQIFSDHTLGQLFGTNNEANFLSGESAEQADTVGIWNADTQTSRVFYFQTGEGWREAGNEAAGDQAGISIPFPSALVINRRGSTPLELTVLGGVPMPLEQRYFHVSPGRNLISAPFSMAQTIADYQLFVPGSPFSVKGATSAPEADTIRFTNSYTAAESEVIYYQLGSGWKIAGSDGDAAATQVELGQAMDFQRSGPAGYIKAFGVIEETPVPRALRTSAETIAISRSSRVAGGVQFEWKSEAGASYQIQTQVSGRSAWEDLGEPVAANHTTATAVRTLKGAGQIRIVKKQAR